MVAGSKEAMLFHTLPSGAVKCELCNRNCIIQIEQRGFCGVRENRGGVLYSLVYGKACVYGLDPIEKKPFYHFMPGAQTFSFATVGCNFACQHCQNWEISQIRGTKQITGEDLPPAKIVKMAKAGEAQGIAYTYTEPTIFFEYAYDTAELAKREGMFNVFVTNGYMTDKCIDKMQNIDASRIDLKSFKDEHYMNICGGAHLEPVLNSIKMLHAKQHIEIITLLIPTLNDSKDELHAMATWIKDLSPDIPLHFTAYYPTYKMTLPPTPVETLEKAREIATEIGLKYVYTGNVPGHEGENTYCPNCHTMLIRRFGFTVVDNHLLREGNRAKCPECGNKINVVTKIEKKE